ncbi:LanC-like protein [Nymphaea thermarum]|nr:LanC-like protein [Nymphaea thermarum]
MADIIINGGEAQEKKSTSEGYERPARSPLTSAEAFLKAAISLKEQVVKATWIERGGRTIDPTIYTGLLGTAFTCLRTYESTGNKTDLLLCSEIVDSCAVVAESWNRHVTFLCGRGGAYALGAVAAKYRDDHERLELFLNLFNEVAQEKALPVGPEEGGFGMAYELIYGRVGFLWAALFINKHIGDGTVDMSILMPIVDAVLAGGRVGASHSGWPLMYQFHGTRYWGAAHGLAGIMQVLLHFPLPHREDVDDVKGTLRYMIGHRFFHSGNYPSSEGNGRDKLVQWSHGAGGMAITLCKASQVFPEDMEFRTAAIDAGEVVWKRGLSKKVGLYDGLAGNAYAFLSLYRLTGERLYADRAKGFASILYQNVHKLALASPASFHPYSLFQGLAGAACLMFDLANPQSARFPGYEL